MTRIARLRSRPAWLVGFTVVIALTVTAAVGIGGAGAQDPEGPQLSIEPTSGPIGTVITATISNCEPPETFARLDFSFVGFTPANTVDVFPDEGGNATVTIEAVEKEGQSEELTEAELILSQCGNEGVARVEFQVIRDTDDTDDDSDDTDDDVDDTDDTDDTEDEAPEAPAAEPRRATPSFTG